MRHLCGSYATNGTIASTGLNDPSDPERRRGIFLFLFGAAQIFLHRGRAASLRNRDRGPPGDADRRPTGAGRNRPLPAQIPAGQAESDQPQETDALTPRNRDVTEGAQANQASNDATANRR